MKPFLRLNISSMNHPLLFFRGRIEMNNKYGIGFILRDALKKNWRLLSRPTIPT
jgi:hypothetical protein